MVNPVCPFAPQDGCGDCVFWNDSRQDCIIKAVKEMNLEEHERLIRERKLIEDFKSLQTLEAEFESCSKRNDTFNWEYDGGIGSY